MSNKKRIPRKIKSLKSRGNRKCGSFDKQNKIKLRKFNEINRRLSVAALYSFEVSAAFYNLSRVFERGAEIGDLITFEE